MAAVNQAFTDRELIARIAILLEKNARAGKRPANWNIIDPGKLPGDTVRV
jgi:hypothetical protein